MTELPGIFYSELKLNANPRKYAFRNISNAVSSQSRFGSSWVFGLSFAFRIFGLSDSVFDLWSLRLPLDIEVFFINYTVVSVLLITIFHFHNMI